MKSLSREELRSYLVPRRPEDHKGTFGHVLVAAGSRGMAGAAILCTRAALRSGAGLVTLSVPRALQSSIAGRVPEAMTLALPESPAGTLRQESAAKLAASHEKKGFTVMALGPGLSSHPHAGRFVEKVLSILPLPAVVDADALNLLASRGPSRAARLLGTRKDPCVFTPHPGEMARCLSTSTRLVMADREGSAEKLARAWGGVALLKGHGTLVSDGKRTVINRTGGTGLSKGGSGDVLTGLIAGLWAQMIASGRVSGDLAFKAAALGAWLHGTAGDLAEKDLGPSSMTAQDVIDRLPLAFKKL